MQILTLIVHRLANTPSSGDLGAKCGFFETTGNPMGAVGPFYLSEKVGGTLGTMLMMYGLFRGLQNDD